MAEVELDVIDQKLITSLVADRIRDAIESRELTPGQRIGEAEMSGRLQVSRTPVREAFRMLETEGYLTHSPRCGVIVKELRRDEIIDVFEVRSWLEQLMIRKICRSASPVEREKLNALRAQMETLLPDMDEAAFRALDEGFHDVLVANCGNPKLAEIVKNLKINTKLIRNRAGFSLARAQESFRECIALVDAINQRDEDMAAALMHNHFDKSLAFFLASVSSEGE